MAAPSEDLVGLTELDATCFEDSKYAYTTFYSSVHGQGQGGKPLWKRGYSPLGTGGFGAVFREECIEGLA
jgi:hypothetical protein